LQVFVTVTEQNMALTLGKSSTR